MDEPSDTEDTLVGWMLNLRTAVGCPTLRTLSRHADFAGTPLPIQTLSAILQGKRQRPTWDTVLAFVQACERCAAAQHDMNIPRDLFDRGMWLTRWQETSPAKPPETQTASPSRPGVYLDHCTGVITDGKNARLAMTIYNIASPSEGEDT